LEICATVGRSGGMLLGVDSDLYEVLEECGKYHIKMQILDKYSKMKWHLDLLRLKGKRSFLRNLHKCIINVKGLL
jgi:hypothetical protein